jgi:hypothetical protein
MLFAVNYHETRGELPQIVFSGTFLVVAAFVAAGRFFIAPF